MALVIFLSKVIQVKLCVCVFCTVSNKRQDVEKKKLKKKHLLSYTIENKYEGKRQELKGETSMIDKNVTKMRTKSCQHVYIFITFIICSLIKKVPYEAAL